MQSIYVMQFTLCKRVVMFKKERVGNTSEVQTQQLNVSEFNFIIIIKTLAQIIKLKKKNLTK